MKHNFLENELIVLTKQTLDIFLKTDNFAELTSLYTFYYYTAKWQKTNQVKCTTDYVAKALHWTRNKVIKFKKQLVEFGLIEDVRIVDEATKKVKGYYVKMNYIFKKTTLENTQCIQNPPTGNEYTKNSKASVFKIKGVEKEDTNAYSTNKLNALNTNNKYIYEKYTEEEKEITRQLIEKRTEQGNEVENELEILDKVSKILVQVNKKDFELAIEKSNKDVLELLEIKKIKAEIRKIKANLIPSMINSYTDNEQLKAVLNEFIEYRAEMKKKITALSLNKILKDLSSKEVDEQILAIEKSIKNGWTGIFVDNKINKRGGINVKKKEKEEVEDSFSDWFDNK